MAKKTKKAKKSSSQVVVKVTGGALPSPICLSAGHVIGTVEERLRNLNLVMETSRASELREYAMGVGVGLKMIVAQFPLTEKKLKPLSEKFYSKTLKNNVTLKQVIREASMEIGDLKRKAMIGCNVNQV